MSWASGTNCTCRSPRSYELGEPGSTVSLRVHTHVREDALALFGFATVLELDVFERLISISGVGPRLALAVLSGIEPPDLVRAVMQGDVSRLTRIPGVGKKTAERIGLGAEGPPAVRTRFRGMTARFRRRPAAPTGATWCRRCSTSDTIVRWPIAR